MTINRHTAEQIVHDFIDAELEPPTDAPWGHVEDTPTNRIDEALANEWSANDIRLFLIDLVESVL